MALSGSSPNMGKQGVYSLSHNDEFEFYTSKLNSNLQYLLQYTEKLERRIRELEKKVGA